MFSGGSTGREENVGEIEDSFAEEQKWQEERFERRISVRGFAARPFRRQ
jgi:hypothetical protein